MRKNVYATECSKENGILNYHFIGVSAKDVLDFLFTIEHYLKKEVFFYQDIPVDSEGNYPVSIAEIKRSFRYKQKKQKDLISATDIIFTSSQGMNSINKSNINHIIRNPDDFDFYNILFITHDIDWKTQLFCKDRGFIIRFIDFIKSNSYFFFSENESLFV